MTKKIEGRILMILFDNYYPRDPRVRKEISTLIERGFHVDLIVKRGEDEPEREERDNLTIKRVSFPLERRGGTLYGILYYAIFRHSALLEALRRRKINYSLIHVHDLPAAFSSVIAGKFLGVPVLVDLHEDWPDLMLLLARPDSILSRFLSRALYYLLRIEEGLVLRLADGIITTSDIFSEDIIKKGAKSERVVSVENVIDLNEMRRVEEAIKRRYEKGGRFRLVYVGGLAHDQGVDVPIRAVKELEGSLDLEFIVVGDGADLPRLKALVKNLGLEDRVIFTGWLPFEDAMSYVASADLCVRSGKRSRQLEISLPNKVFQYMYFAKPIAAADFKAIRRIINECECGFLFEPENHVDLAKKIMDNIDHLDEMGRRGREYVESKMNWDIVSEKLIGLYSKIIKSPGDEDIGNDP
ncbi:glycosyltransferase WbuB [Candidatus Korarchaeum cryptofilum]|uniref:Glycosyltransferase WbuB n=1 Tax=Candidatus Korarchaeum cryptofilum TaxID=498846 RepID=A0A3R9P9G3_9CREN|nr:glycosyltransferase family 4 protein [Candidatus Korarchaeum cryptofilum]RSN67846.1 glycosyltransferase WbuB [Candidatus Korarchaeum cryptofilum]